MNDEWHGNHPLAKNAMRAQRIEWHAEQATVCGCRGVPPSIRAAVRRLSKT